MLFYKGQTACDSEVETLKATREERREFSFRLRDMSTALSEGIDGELLYLADTEDN